MSEATDTTTEYAMAMDILRNRVNKAHRESVLKIIKSEVRYGSLDKEYAGELFNAIAMECGWETVTSITNTFTVEVSYNGSIIGVFEGIEANDEAHAEETISQDIEVKGELSLTLSHSGQTLTGSAYIDSWNVDEELVFNAEIEEN
jgi:hypothetical protein